MASLGDLMVRVGADIAGFQSAMGDVSKRLSAVVRDADNATRGFDKLGDHLTGFGTTLSAAITLPLAGAGLALTKFAGDFDSQMRKVTSIVDNATESDFKNLSAQVLEMSKALGVDAVGAADALYQALSAGVPKDNAVDFVRIASVAAIAGLTDTRVAVDALTTVLQSYNLDASQTKAVSDAMFEAVKVGKLEFPELAASIGIAAGTAHLLGVSYQELLAAGATLTLSTGQKIPEAMTMLQSAMKSLINPTDQMQQLLQKAGYQSGVAAVQSDGLEKVLQKLQIAAGGNVQVFETAFGRIEGFRGAVGLTGTNAAKAAEQLAQLQHASDGVGQTSATAAEINKGFNRQLETFKTNVKDVAIEFGASLLPALETMLKNSKPLITDLEDLAKWFADLSPKTQSLAIALGATAAAAGPLVVGLGLLISSASTVYGSIVALTGVMGAFATTAVTSLATNIAALPAMLSNIATAVSGNMVGALTSGETMLLRFGQAGIAAAAAFAAFKLGQWAYDAIPGVKALGDAMADLLLKIPGVESAIKSLTGAAGSQKQADADLDFATRKLADSLAKKGITVDKTGLSTAQYAAKLRDAAAAAGSVSTAATTSTHAVAEQQKAFVDANKELDAAKQKYGEVSAALASGSASREDLIAALERLRTASQNARKDFSAQSDATGVLKSAEKELADAYKAESIPSVTNLATAMEAVGTARDKAKTSTAQLQAAETSLATLLSQKGTPNAEALVRAIADVDTARGEQKKTLVDLNKAEQDLQVTQQATATATSKVQEAQKAYGEALKLTTEEAVTPYNEAIKNENAAREDVINSANRVLAAEKSLADLVSGPGIKSIKDITDAEDLLQSARVKLTTDTDKFREAQKNLAESAAVTQKATQELREDDQSLDDVFTKMNPHLDSLSGALDEVRKKKDLVKTAADNLKSSEQKLADLLEHENPSIKDVNKATADAKDARDKLKSTSDSLRDSERRLQDTYGVSKEAIVNLTRVNGDLQIASQNAEAALSSMGITPLSAIQQLANKAQEAYSTIVESGTISVGQVRDAHILALQAQVNAYTAEGTSVPAAQQIMLAKLETNREDFITNDTRRWSDLYTGIDGTVKGFAGSAINTLFTGEGSFKEAGIKALQSIGEEVVTTFTKKATDAIANFISGAITNLLSGNGLGGILDSVKSIGSELSKVFNTANGVSNAVSGASGAAGSVASGASGAAGGVGAAASGITGIVSAVGSVVSAISGVIGNFQNAHQETSLNAIEHNTRYTMMYVGERADGGILGVLFRILDDNQFGYRTKDLDYIKASVDGQPQRLDAIKDAISAGSDMLANGIDKAMSAMAAIGQDIRQALSYAQPATAAVTAAGGAAAPTTIKLYIDSREIASAIVPDITALQSRTLKLTAKV